MGLGLGVVLWRGRRGVVDRGKLAGVDLGGVGGSGICRCVCEGGAASGLRVIRRLRVNLSAIDRGLGLLRRRNLVRGGNFFRSANKEGTGTLRVMSSFGVSVNVNVLGKVFRVATMSLCKGTFCASAVSLPCSGAPSCCGRIASTMGRFVSSHRCSGSGILNVSVTARNVASPSRAAMLCKSVVGGTNVGLSSFSECLPCPYCLRRSSGSTAFLRL